MSRSKKVAAVGNGCVACGSCTKPCPVKAISVYKGLYAIVDRSLCIGCGKCAVACPAGIIEVAAREEMLYEKAVV